MKVLCVEPGFLARRKLIRTVRRIVPQAIVHGCRDSAEAAALAKGQGCDVLLTEIDLGGTKWEGLDLARRLKALYPGINIIFITACPEREYARQVIQMRASGYVRKPYEQKRLAEEFSNLRYETA